MMKREKRILVKRMAAAVLSLMLLIAMMPLSVFAEKTGGEPSDLLNLDEQEPAGFDSNDTTNPYGYGLDEPFMMAPQNELLNYITYDGNVKTTISEDFRLDSTNSENITSSQMYGKKAFVKTSPLGETKRYSYVQGIAFDPTGKGRNDYVAYIGYDYDGGRVVVWVVNANTGKSSVAYHAGYADWIKRAGIEQFYASNFFAITAGRYSSDSSSETFVTYSPLGDGNYCLKEWKVFIGSNGGISLSEGGLATSATYLHDVYRKQEWEGPEMASSGAASNMLSASLATGDFNADGIDDLAVLSYVNRPESKYQKINTQFFAPQLTFVHGGGSGPILNRTNIKKTILRDNISGDKDDWYTWHTMRSPTVAAGDVNGDGYDEIMVGGYTAYTYSQRGSENFNTDTAYERQTSVTVAGYSYKGSNVNKILFNSFGYEDNKSVMNKYTEQIVKKHNDNIMAPLIMETVALDGGANPEYIFVNGTFCVLNEDGTLEHKYTPDYFRRWDGKSGDMDNISRNFIQSAAVGVYDNNTVGREQIAVSVGMKESGEDDYAFMLLA